MAQPQDYPRSCRAVPSRNVLPFCRSGVRAHTGVQGAWVREVNVRTCMGEQGQETQACPPVCVLFTLAEVKLGRALSPPKPMNFIFLTVLTRNGRGLPVRKAKAL